MKVLVYPHSMELGGSQINAIQLAGGIRDRGHEVTVLSEPGPLVDRVRQLYLDHVELPLRRGRPSLTAIHTIGDLVKRRGFDVVHG
ncbi:MAG: group 1 glycosyl transferase, partial [Alcaligenaceae bacterium]